VPTTKIRTELAEDWYGRNGYRFKSEIACAIAAWVAGNLSGFRAARKMNELAVDRAYQDGLARGRQLAEQERRPPCPSIQI